MKKISLYMIKKCCYVFFFLILSNGVFAQSVTSSSTVDWTKNSFTSTVNFDMEAANLSFPTGKTVAVNKMNMYLPLMIKDPLLALKVDSSNMMGDLVIRDEVPFDNISSLIKNAKRTPGVFSRNGMELTMDHDLDMLTLSSLLVRHTYPYSAYPPIEQTATREYTGIIIDARGALPVQGEFVKDETEPCFFPKVWDEQMNLIYEKNMVQPTVAQNQGIIHYDYSSDESRYKDRVGNDPLRIRARKVYGVYRTDPVISRKDALRILSLPENMELLSQGKVVILLDKENLIYPATAPDKDAAYYVALRELKSYTYTDKVPDVTIDDIYRGLQISIQNLQFVADSSELLPGEEQRLDELAEMVKTVTDMGNFTISIEGHTASVGKPTGEMELSLQRAKAIMDALQQRGVDTTDFTYKGFGGTVPIGDNSTDEGRAMNRRVEIMVIPKTTYVQRSPDALPEN